MPASIEDASLTSEATLQVLGLLVGVRGIAWAMCVTRRAWYQFATVSFVAIGAATSCVAFLI